LKDKRQAFAANFPHLLFLFLIGGLMLAGCAGRLFTPEENVPGIQASRMKLALIHFAAVHKKPHQNLAELVRLNREAAEAGASLILNTEMAVSGYSFKSRQNIAPYTETDQGPTMRAMGKLADTYHVYIGIAFAERDPSTDIYYNTAILLGPDGRTMTKYRKVLTERRWARSGSPTQQGVADTPWGRIGTAICADSYNGLIPRTMALKGVDLLWVPANWPTMGGLDPMTVWRARALENGFYLAACNRTGQDLTMDCTQAVSCVIDPAGRAVFAGALETSRVFMVELPLDSNGHWADVRRANKIQDRKINYYRPIYLMPWMEDFTGFYKLPEPGPIQIHCLVPPAGELKPDDLRAQIEKQTDPQPALWVLPTVDSDDIDVGQLADLASQYQVAIAVAIKSSATSTRRVLITPDGVRAFMETEDAATLDGRFPFKILHFGPAAIAMAPVDAFAHPELAVALSKLGGDLVILSEDTLSAEDFLLSRIKSLAGVAVASCASNGAQITGVHDRHFNWEYKAQDGPGVLTYMLDTAKTRRKLFHENMDYDLLLAN
jgi:predicted amidohydrolase